MRSSSIVCIRMFFTSGCAVSQSVTGTAAFWGVNSHLRGYTFASGRANPPFTNASGPVLNIELTSSPRVGSVHWTRAVSSGFQPRASASLASQAPCGRADIRPNGTEGRHVLDSQVHLHGRDAPIRLENLQKRRGHAGNLLGLDDSSVLLQHRVAGLCERLGLRRVLQVVGVQREADLVGLARDALRVGHTKRVDVAVVHVPDLGGAAGNRAALRLVVRRVIRGLLIRATLGVPNQPWAGRASHVGLTHHAAELEPNAELCSGGRTGGLAAVATAAAPTGGGAYGEAGTCNKHDDCSDPERHS